jgi:hypothetical protein
VWCTYFTVVFVIFHTSFIAETDLLLFFIFYLFQVQICCRKVNYATDTTALSEIVVFCVSLNVYCIENCFKWQIWILISYVFYVIY